jgi:hypothetical protein
MLVTPSGGGVPAREYTQTVNTSRFAVVAPRAGIAVLGETFLPGEFRATLNGAPVPYFRVNHAFKGVVIPSAGEWTVQFEYRPSRWHVSLIGAGLGVVTLAGLAVQARRQ